MTIEFAISYLTNGTEEEVELRKKEFKTLPNLEQIEEQQIEEQQIEEQQIEEQQIEEQQIEEQQIEEQQIEEQQTEEQENEEQENEKEPSIRELKELYPQFAGAKDKKTLLKKIAEYESKKELDSE
jgi:hypothetical protein